MYSFVSGFFQSTFCLWDPSKLFHKLVPCFFLNAVSYCTFVAMPLWSLVTTVLFFSIVDIKFPVSGPKMDSSTFIFALFTKCPLYKSQLPFGLWTGDCPTWRTRDLSVAETFKILNISSEDWLKAFLFHEVRSLCSCYSLMPSMTFLSHQLINDYWELSECQTLGCVTRSL